MRGAERGTLSGSVSGGRGESRALAALDLHMLSLQAILREHPLQHCHPTTPRDLSTPRWTSVRAHPPLTSYVNLGSHLSSLSLLPHLQNGEDACLKGQRVNEQTPVSLPPPCTSPSPTLGNETPRKPGGRQ